MDRKAFSITIDAPREKVWEILWSDETYPVWTAIFAEGSRAETDWQKGSKIRFLDAKNRGMVSAVADNIPNEFMSIKHLGNIIDGVEDTDSESAKEWSGSLENYTLKNVNGKTELKVDMDITDEFADYLEQTWPKALKALKDLAEKN